MKSPPDAKRILPVGPKDESDKGRLTATILSVYDLPSNAQPSHVSMTLLGEEVHSGPPSAKHRERNSFKFVSNDKDSKANGSGMTTLDKWMDTHKMKNIIVIYVYRKRILFSRS